MSWGHYIAWFFCGAFLANAAPHLISGLMGRAFQTPFASPPGEGLSSSTVNVLWGGLNLVIGYLLLSQIGQFDAGNLLHAGSTGLGGFLVSLALAQHFGRFNGGNRPGP